MHDFQAAGLYFESHATDTRKFFKISFPVNALLELHWAPADQKKLKELDGSESVADQLELLALIARKIEKAQNSELLIHGEHDE